MAKHIMLLNCAIFTTEYDIEMLTDTFKLGKVDLGFVGKPQEAIPVRIKLSSYNKILVAKKQK